MNDYILLAIIGTVLIGFALYVLYKVKHSHSSKEQKTIHA